MKKPGGQLAARREDLVPLDGLEPSHLAPEASALSSELQGHLRIPHRRVSLTWLIRLRALIVPQSDLDSKCPSDYNGLEAPRQRSALPQHDQFIESVAESRAT